jgi:peptidoglycan/LPS O-acetylase OafA/YrhL
MIRAIPGHAKANDLFFYIQWLGTASTRPAVKPFNRHSSWSVGNLRAPRQPADLTTPPAGLNAHLLPSRFQPWTLGAMPQKEDRENGPASGAFAVAAKNRGKPVFHTLDGMRGVAALLVVLRHTTHFFGDFSFQQSYLAVDVFFAMSGVVLTNAYEQRLKAGLSAKTFAWIRLVRLYPLYALGLALSVLALALGADHEKARWLVWTLPLAVLLLPNFFAFTGTSTFPLNGPSWSLFMELWVNIIYGRFVSEFSKRNLLLIMAFSAVGLVVGEYLSPRHNLDFGWTQKSFVFAFFRVGYSYFAGVLIYRMFAANHFTNLTVNRSLAAWALLLTMAALLMCSPSPSLQPFFDLVCVTAFFPAIVYAALFFQPDGHTRSICAFLGAISYPAYAIHSPLGAFSETLLRNFAGLSVRDYAPYSGLVFLAALLPLCWVLNNYDVRIRALLNPKRAKPVI